MLRKIIFIFILAAAVLNSSLDAKKLKILGVGNSFTVNATKYFNELVKASGNEVEYTGAIIGGSSFRVHLDAAKKFDKDPASVKGRPYTIKGSKESLQELLKKEKWDIVTIQQVSGESFKVESFRPDAKEIYDYIKKYCPGAEVVLHRTWAYSDEMAFGITAEKMNEGIVNAYESISKELKCRVIPSGDTFKEARKDPELKLKLYADKKHAGLYGEYMAGCVWLEILFGESCIGNKYSASLDKDKLKQLQEIAHNASEKIKEKNKRYR